MNLGGVIGLGWFYPPPCHGLPEKHHFRTYVLLNHHHQKKTLKILPDYFSFLKTVTEVGTATDCSSAAPGIRGRAARVGGGVCRASQPFLLRLHPFPSIIITLQTLGFPSTPPGKNGIEPINCTVWLELLRGCRRRGSPMVLLPQDHDINHEKQQSPHNLRQKEGAEN